MIRKDVRVLVRDLREDERYQRLRKLFDTSPLYRLSIENLTDEIMTLHKTRAIRRLNALDPQIVNAVVNAITIDQSNRSRLTEISITCLKAKASLEDALDALRHHLLATYQEDLRQFRTKDERAIVMDMVFRQFRRYITKVDILKATSDMVISDIDKGAWSIRSLVDALKIHAAREVTV